MNDNNIEPIDPATCEPDKWWLVRLKPSSQEWPAWRSVAGRWHLISYTTSFHDAEVDVLAELVRADGAQAELERERESYGRLALELDQRRDERDVWAQKYGEAQKDVERLVSERDRWKAECEKAQTERDEATAERGEWQTAFADLERQHDELRQTTTELRTELTKAELRAKIGAAVDPDPTSASRLQLAIETLDKLSEPDADGKGCSHWSARDLQRIEREAEAAAAREQERDAEIAVLVRAFSAVGGDGPMLADAAAAALDDLAAHRNERSEK